ncbi:MAG TPA: hypothetical protein G4O15_06240 [Dehalococcoidia bacterium]|nr:hypothetical protein [Dehalococcoidia bacterium]
MKKITISLLLALTVIAITAVPVSAAKGDNPANDKPNNLYLYEKDSNWDIVWDGAWGKLTTNKAGNVKFNGKRIEPGCEYALIVYTDPWPGDPITIIGTDVANKGGNVNIKGELGPVTGVKIWLVPADDVTETGMTAWNPAEYLFEHNLFTIPDPDA